MSNRLLLVVVAIAALTLAVAGFALVTLTGIWRPTSSQPMPRPPLPPTAPNPPQSGPTLRVAADSFGCFTPVAGEPTEVWPGAGVRAFVGGFGRLEPGVTDAFVYVRGPDGAFEQRRVERMPTAQREEWRPDGGAGDRHPLRDGFLAAATSWATSNRVLRERSAGETPPVAPPLAPTALVPRSPPSPGADLAEWAPADAPFIRFRSTEAAFRFADVADRIAARLAAAAGDGRDYGSLRWALHDLTLPAVWSANPEGTRGAGECAVVLDGLPGLVGLPARGRARLGAVLRIVDPDLYRMESEAGVSYAALPEHRWSPADDPHPEARPRRNHRRTIADVEAIGSDTAILARFAEPTGAALASDPEFAALAAVHTRTDAEAAFLFVPRAARSAAGANEAAERFASGGVAHLWTEWTGTPLPGELVPDVTAPGRPSLVASVVYARVVTDAKGADVEVGFVTADAATQAAAALEAVAHPFTAGTATCARTRHDIAPLAVMDRPQKDFAERCFVVLGWKPVCPCGGTYVVHPITREVSCTAHGTDAKPLADPPAPPRIVRNVVADGATLRFRVPIDWNR